MEASWLFLQLIFDNIVNLIATFSGIFLAISTCWLYSMHMSKRENKNNASNMVHPISSLNKKLN